MLKPPSRGAISSIYDAALYRQSKQQTVSDSSRDWTDKQYHAFVVQRVKALHPDKEMLGWFTALKPGESMAFKPNDFDSIDEMKLAYNKATTCCFVLNPTRTDIRYVVQSFLGEADKHNKYAVKYSARKIKQVVRQGGLTYFTIMRLV